MIYPSEKKDALKLACMDLVSKITAGLTEDLQHAARMVIRAQGPLQIRELRGIERNWFAWNETYGSLGEPGVTNMGFRMSPGTPPLPGYPCQSEIQSRKSMAGEERPAETGRTFALPICSTGQVLTCEEYKTGLFESATACSFVGLAIRKRAAYLVVVQVNNLLEPQAAFVAGKIAWEIEEEGIRQGISEILYIVVENRRTDEASGSPPGDDKQGRNHEPLPRHRIGDPVRLWKPRSFEHGVKGIVSKVITIEEYYAPTVISKGDFDYQRGPHAYYPDEKGWQVEGSDRSWGLCALPDKMVVSEVCYQRARARRTGIEQRFGWPE